MEKGSGNGKGEREWKKGGMEGGNRKDIGAKLKNFHSRESGNLAGRHRPPRIATGDIALPLRGISRIRGKRFPLSREWKRGREWNKRAGME